jgi:hypothetical protein
VSSYYAETVTPRSSPQFRAAGSGRFLDAYTGAKAKEAEFLTSAIDAKYNKKIAYKTAQGPSSEPRSFDFGALAKGAAGLASGLAGAFKPQTATNPYAMDFGSFNPAQQYGLNLDTSSFWSGGGMDASLGANLYSNPAIGNLDFGLGGSLGSTAFGG